MSSVGRISKRTAQAITAQWTTPFASTSSTIFPSQSTQFSSTSQSYSSRPTVSGNASPVVRKKRTILDLHSLKRKGIPITVLTAHDYPSGRFIESASAPLMEPKEGVAGRRGIDICLIGDSLAMVACGYESTSYLGLEELLYHARAVARGCKTSFIVCDMPFGTFGVDVTSGIANAVRIIQEGRADAVKIEGGFEVVELVTRLTSIGIPVMGHVGLKPQRQASLSGFRVQGKTIASALAVYHEALAIQAAGAFSIVLEAVPSRLGTFISKKLDIPVIGIGAGVKCDGQVLVQLDMLGVNSLGKGPKFLKKFSNMEDTAVRAIEEYALEVREGTFPVEDIHGYPMEDEVWEGFLNAVKQVKQE